MSKAFSKVLVMTLMLVAFVGQAFAYSAMPCEMSSGSHESHMNMDHGDMNMDSMDHDMATMPSMQGMTPEQHHQHMKYMQGMTKLQELFKQLNQTKDKNEIKAILGKIKEHSKKSHQQFRQDC